MECEKCWSQRLSINVNKTTPKYPKGNKRNGRWKTNWMAVVGQARAISWKLFEKNCLSPDQFWYKSKPLFLVLSSLRFWSPLHCGHISSEQKWYYSSIFPTESLPLDFSGSYSPFLWGLFLLRWSWKLQFLIGSSSG